jgi:diadenosine tetraphosphate (Ap4A) HIT family hydrolase
VHIIAGMDEGATLIEEHSHESNPGKPTDDFKPSCPFCVIASTYRPVSPLSAPGSSLLESTKLDPPSFVLFSNEHVIAFLDIMPLTRGHVLIAPRKHRVKIGDLSASESAEIGRVLPLIARSVLKSVLPDIPHDEADYNLVQNNGPGAAQVVPHVHFHLIPRPPLNYTYPARASKVPPKHSKYPPNEQPTARARNAVIFGRGIREDLDYDESEILVEEIRQAIKDECDPTSAMENLDLTSDNGVPESKGETRSKKGGWKV